MSQAASNRVPEDKDAVINDLVRARNLVVHGQGKLGEDAAKLEHRLHVILNVLDKLHGNAKTE